jgi:hypothetical protein
MPQVADTPRRNERSLHALFRLAIGTQGEVFRYHAGRHIPTRGSGVSDVQPPRLDVISGTICYLTRQFVRRFVGKILRLNSGYSAGKSRK